MKTKILFISHEASLTGAPLVLLYFMEWLKKHHPDDFEIGILHLKGGEIENRFNAVAQHVYYIENNPNKSIAFKVANKLSKGKLKKNQQTPLQKCIDKIALANYNLIYANTVVALPVGVEIKKASVNKPKLIAHVHELYVGLKRYITKPDLVLPFLDHVIAVSQVVKNNILAEWHLEKSKLSVVYEFSKLKSKLGKDNFNKNDKFVVGASGTVFWRKGYEYFIQVARYLSSHYPKINVDFIWVGKINDIEKLIINEDLKKLNLTNTVKFVGQQLDPFSYFQQFDIFLMTSKEDPFPLVCIEVGMLGKPIICFDKATGTQEMLENGGGKVVPYLDIEQMAETVVEYYNNEDLLKRDSKIAKEMFKGFTPGQKCPEIFSVLNKLLY